MVVFNDKVFFNKSIVLVLINDNEVFFYGFMVLIIIIRI